MVIYRKEDEGAALLTILLLVAIMAVIAAATLDRLKLSTQLASNGAAMVQARSTNHAIEAIAVTRLEDILTREAGQTSLEGNWLNHDIPIPLDRGTGTARVSDGGNCFNLNSLAITKIASPDTGALSPNSESILQFVTLMTLLQIPKADAEIIAQSTADWIDNDPAILPMGAEDAYYRGLEASYLPANNLMVERSEIRAVRGMTPAYYNRLKNWICALPEAEPTKVNVNSLSPGQSILLSMLFGDKLSPVQAKAYLAKRPNDGYGSLIRFWSAPVMATLKPSATVQGQIQLKSQYYHLHSQIISGQIELESRALIDARSDVPFILWRSFGDEG